MEIPRTLVLTGHFPPEPGGVQTFTWELARRLPEDRLIVVAPAWPGAAEFDAGLGFPVVRRRAYLLFRGLRRLVVRHQVEAGWITAAAPFGMYAPLVRAAGVRWLVGSAHGQELGWFRAPPTRAALRAAARSFDVLTHLSATTLPELRDAVGDRTRLARLAGAVDTVRFRPGLDGTAVRRRHGLGGGPVVLSVARLVRRKGHDMLIRAWGDVVRRCPDARLVIVGDGPMRRRLTEMADREAPGTVTVTGPVPAAELPRYYAAANVFSLPCRDDRAGLQTEGLGLSVLEASASGLPVVVGRSGGSPESLVDGLTGVLVDATGPDEIALALHGLLGSPARAAAMGAAGRRWTCERWSWDAAAARLAALLKGSVLDAPPKHDTPGMEPAWDSGSS
ncbi:phosphatidylinositol alpha-1,6-mannosyltransferase [Actinomadura coerulea]|uniref:Phosphatidylinositol alpha-1,6-mannosyltransferase n=1 Tax=Actinomadura coerulea TaxID=46159 RepID=A0A7X0L3I5_9ACTN|nr:glycosyltransferase family 4 protein [Actinomadura coerulea]MBB6400309.1 phosphatidylinositol alpha-1,6-mannosyltransferase [Actinomadura coerulea]GGQ40168.1 GDP-mannose-dependent alpha-(1-6)-phosphatidylinositol monomannoside mannosyltransferase [Actinomadura coerulea]